MAKFLTIGYGDASGYERTDPEVRTAAHAVDASLRARGAIVGVAGTPVQVRNPANTGARTSDGPYAQAALPVAGFALIDAKDLNEAIALVAGTPCAVAHGVVEIWPLEEPGNDA